ncbi:MAG: acetate kinase [FCB group bacterium]|jgi:acetate kinase|nr:acetate kinase [FCB group bacterium]
MKILVLNSGSSSIKYKVFDCEQGDKVLAQGQVERIGLPNPILRCSCDMTRDPNCNDIILGNRSKIEVPDHTAAMSLICKLLLDERCPIIKDLSEIAGVGHRVVHGGEFFSESVVIDDEVTERIRECARLAPLHNPPALRGIEAVNRAFPDAVQVAVFDTAFHASIPRKAYLYPLPMSLYEKHGIRKYGFHGTSHLYVSRRAAEILGKPIEETKIITCHLGNGSSITAVKGGKSVDTSMGLTPLAGVMMGTRSGDLDPYIPIFMIKELGMSADEVERKLNKESGFLGICKYTDVRDIERLAKEGDPDADLALEMFAYRVANFVGAYAMALDGVDAIVFTGGIGEKDADMRVRILRNAAYLGVQVDPELNARAEINVATKGSKVAALVIPTDEEKVIARDTARLVEASQEAFAK